MRLKATKRVSAVVAAMSLVAACGSDSPVAEEASDPAAEPAESTETAESTESESPAAADSSGEAAAATEQASADSEAASEPVTIAVTTNILGDVVTNLAGDQAEVITIMPVGADPHDFQASAQEVNALVSADALIVNGAGFEEGLLDVIDSATDEGVPTHAAMEGMSTIEFGEGGHSDHGHDEHGDEDHSEHGDEEHADEKHGDEEHSDHSEEEHSDEEHSKDEAGHDDHSDHEGHDHEGVDPHFFTDPMRMVTAVQGIVDFLSNEVDGLDAAQLSAAADDYIASLTAVDAEVLAALESIPEERRILVTNHEVFGYFADRYGFEVVGTVIPGGSTADGASAGELAALADLISDEGVPAIFSDTTASQSLADTLAAEVGEISVVPLYTESLGEAGSDGATYLDMIRTNALRMAEALA